MSQPVAAKIAAEIAAQGPISFARFMDLALYCPDCGYYEKEGDRIGRGGDFFTSVSVGCLFGELLAFRFSGWLRELWAGGTGQSGDTAGTKPGQPITRQPPCLVEAGAHDGRLARDILTWLEATDPDLFGRLIYYIVESSARRRGWQEATLGPLASRVRWVRSLAELCGGRPDIRGIVLSNELFDAFPVHRFGWDAAAGSWFEWGVAASGGDFRWTRIPATAPPPRLDSALTAVLPDGYVLERCPAAEEWYRQSAAVLAAGRLVTFDYGFTNDEALLPERQNGTARAYSRHRVSAGLLAKPGEQDLTAHVNFSALERAGLAAGLSTELFTHQEQFLMRIVAETTAEGSRFGVWTPQRAAQLRTLTHPQQLGRAFRVLVQVR